MNLSFHCVNQPFAFRETFMGVHELVTDALRKYSSIEDVPHLNSTNMNISLRTDHKTVNEILWSLFLKVNKGKAHMDPSFGNVALVKKIWEECSGKLEIRLNGLDYKMDEKFTEDCLNDTPFQRWHGSHANFREFFNAGDVVGQEVVDYFINVLPTLVDRPTYVQAGEACDYVNGKNTYLTFRREEDWKYLGECHYLGEVVPV